MTGPGGLRPGATFTEERPIGEDERSSLAAQPPQAVIRFLKSYQSSELRVLSQNRSLSAAARQEAKRLLVKHN